MTLFHADCRVLASPESISFLTALARLANNARALHCAAVPLAFCGLHGDRLGDRFGDFLGDFFGDRDFDLAPAIYYKEYNIKNKIK